MGAGWLYDELLARFQVPAASWVNVSGKSYRVELKPGTTYYWTVDAKGLKGELTNSEHGALLDKGSSPAMHPTSRRSSTHPATRMGSYIPNPYRYTWSSVPDAVQYEFTVIWHPDPDDWTNQVTSYTTAITMALSLIR